MDTPLTEADWQKATDWAVVIRCYPPSFWKHRNPAADRKWRLAILASARRVPAMWITEEVTQAISFAELLADGQIAEAEVAPFHERMKKACSKWGGSLPLEQRGPAVFATVILADPSYGSFFDAVMHVARRVYLLANGEPYSPIHVVRPSEEQPYNSAEIAASCETIREIFGNPFRPMRVDPTWRTPTVMQLAQGIYDKNDFDTLPVLADALQDAGCDSDELLQHLRQPGGHVRGCWALDLVLGRE